METSFNTIKKIVSRITLAPEEKLDLRTKILYHIHTHPYSQSQTTHQTFGFKFAAFFMSLLVVLTGSVGIVQASRYVGPDSVLYPVKIFAENTYSMIITDPAKKIAWNIHLTDKRLEELTQLALSEKYSSERAEKITHYTEQYDQIIQNTHETLEQIAPLQAIALQEDYESMLKVRSTVLARVKDSRGLNGAVQKVVLATQEKSTVASREKIELQEKLLLDDVDYKIMIESLEKKVQEKIAQLTLSETKQNAMIIAEVVSDTPTDSVLSDHAITTTALTKEVSSMQPVLLNNMTNQDEPSETLDIISTELLEIIPTDTTIDDNTLILEKKEEVIFTEESNPNNILNKYNYYQELYTNNQFKEAFIILSEINQMIEEEKLEQKLQSEITKIQ